MRFIIINLVVTDGKYHPYYTVETPEEVMAILDQLFEDNDLSNKAYFWCQSVLWNDEYKTKFFEIRARV